MTKLRDNPVDTLFERAVNDYRMLDGVACIVTGLSGGSDSIVLLHKLAELQNEGQLTVVAAHVNHMIRGYEADSDEMFCADLCKTLGIHFEVLHADIPKLAAERKTGIEATARDVRYSFFSDIMKKYGAEKTAVAHNADDLTETLLFNVTRGAGLNGIVSVRPVRDWIIRPLIYCRKEEIIKYCENHGYSFVTDRTNADIDYSRNKIRHCVIPVLKSINPSFTESAIRLSESVSTDVDFLESSAKKYSFRDGRMILSKLHDAVLRRVIIRELEASGIRPEYTHVRAAAELIRKGGAHASLSFPGGTMVLDRNEIHTTKPENSHVPETTELFYGTNQVGKFCFTITDKKPDGEAIFIMIDKCIFEKGLFVRKRKPGDRYIINGMSKTLKKLFQEKKYTRSQAENCLVVCNRDDRIIWITGFRQADHTASDDNNSIYIILEQGSFL